MKAMKKVILKSAMISMLVGIICTNGLAQDSTVVKKFFIGYELLEMSMNRFQYFAGEAGYRINTKNQVRLMIGEINLTERHLSSKYEAFAVDGDNVAGYFRIYELYIDHYFGKKKLWYFSSSAGFVNNKYEHLISDNKINHHSTSMGFALGFRKTNLFGVKHLYLNASVPVRYYLNPLPEQIWGDTKIREQKFVNNLWLFIGYNF